VHAHTVCIKHLPECAGWTNQLKLLPCLLHITLLGSYNKQEVVLQYMELTRMMASNCSNCCSAACTGVSLQLHSFQEPVLTCRAPGEAQPQLQLLLLQRILNYHAAGASAHLAAEAELANALDLVVIPYHHLPQQHLQMSESEFHSHKSKSKLLQCQDIQ
jgi:hypothetical protein